MHTHYLQISTETRSVWGECWPRPVMALGLPQNVSVPWSLIQTIRASILCWGASIFSPLRCLEAVWIKRLNHFKRLSLLIQSVTRGSCGLLSHIERKAIPRTQRRLYNELCVSIREVASPHVSQPVRWNRRFPYHT